MKSFTLSLIALIAVLATLQSAHAKPPKKVPTYWQDVRPVLRKNCAYCHAQRHIKKMDVSGGLALDTYESIRKGKDAKHPAIKIGDSAKSLIVERMLTKDLNKRMPLDGEPMLQEDIQLIRQWIDTGAKEGQRPDDEPAPVTVAKANVRKLNVLLPTKAVPPGGLLGKTPPAALSLNLKVGPLAPITAVTFSPDGKLLATGYYGQVAVWDLQNVKQITVLKNVLGAVNDLAFSPDGKTLAVAGGQPSAKGELRLYQTSDWMQLAAFRDHDDVVFSVAFSPDGKKLAAASFDHTISIWDTSALKREKLLDAHSDFVYAVAFHPNGKVLASASKDRSVRLTEVASGKSLFTLGGMNEDVMAVTFNHDGKQVISSGFESQLHWWNAETGEQIRKQGGHGIAVHEIKLSKDGEWLVSAAADRTVRIWNGKSGALLRSITVGSPVYTVAVSPDKKWIASGSFDGFVRLWNTANGQEFLSLLSLTAEDDEAPWLITSPNGVLAADKSLTEIGRWTMRGTSVPADPVWQALNQPEALSKALQSGQVPAVKFGK